MPNISKVNFFSTFSFSFSHRIFTAPCDLQVFVVRGKGWNVFSFQISWNNFRREIHIHLHYSIHSSNDDFTEISSLLSLRNLLSVFTPTHWQAHVCRVVITLTKYFATKDDDSGGRNNKSRRRSGAEWKSEPAGETRIIYFFFHCFAGFRRKVKTSGRGMKTIWAIVWSLLLYVSVVNLSAAHFSCRTGEMLPTLNPRKHTQKRFHVKQIFMFIFRSEFMKQ